MANLEDNLAKGNTSNIGLTGSVANDALRGDWNLDQAWWRENFSDRPYVSADRRFEDYEPGYRFAYQSQSRYHGKKWDDVEPHLAQDWRHYEGRGESTWEHVKDSVRDAWDRITR
jgi:hypothetical protein